MTIQNNYPAIKPLLNLDFANTKQLDPRITFTRASTATYYDGKTFAKAEENLLIYSQEFSNVSWAKTRVTVTGDTATAPDGTATADTITNTTAAGPHEVDIFSSGYVFVAGLTYTASFFAKKNTNDFFQITFFGASGALGTGRANFDLQNGTAGTVDGGTSTITSVGNGWYRCTYTVTAAASGTSNTYAVLITNINAARFESYTGLGTESIYLWGAQLEQRSTATAYTPTTTASVINYIPVIQTAQSGVARFDHNPLTFESLGLEIEEQRTNLLTHSEHFDSAVWTKSNATITANTIVAPDGALTGDKLVENTANGFHLAQSATITPTASTLYTFTCYAKAAERTQVSVAFTGGGSADSGVIFDLLNGTYVATIGVAPNSYNIISVGNGWYRCSITWATTNTNVMAGRVYCALSSAISYTGNGYSGIYIWGAQLETGAFATSYIPTALTYSGRASTATFRGTNGLLQTAGVNTARYEVNSGGGSNLLLEGAASNLLTYTEHLDNAAWTKTRANIALNSAVAPDGTLTGDKLVEDTTASNTHFVMQTIAVTSGTSYTFSVYAKAAERSRILIAVSSAAFTANQAIFDLSNGTTSNLVACTASIAAVGSGWYRCSWTATATASASPTFNIFLETGTPTYTGDGTSGVHIWGAQLETGGAATSYISSIETWTGRASTATYYDLLGVIRTAASGQPRYSYNPQLLSAPPKLLLEPQATNLLLRSEEFQTQWTAERTTVQTNATTAPDGALTADKLLEDTSPTTHNLYQGLSNLTAGSVLSFSIYVKASELSSLRLQINDGSSLANAVFANYDVSTGVASGTQSIGTFTAANSAITSVGNGWYRCSISGVITGVTAVHGRIFLVSGGTPSFTGLGTRGIFIWGAQLEAGAGATSYVPTAGSQVTRAADTSTSAAQSRATDVSSSAQVTRAAEVALMSGTNFSSWYRQAEGTLYAESQTLTLTGNTFALQASDNTYSNRIILGQDSTTVIGQVVVGGSATLFPTSNPLRSNARRKQAFAFATNSAQLATNGVQSAEDTSGAMVTGLIRLDLGSDQGGFNRLNGWLSRIAYYPIRVTNTQLQSLTT